MPLNDTLRHSTHAFAMSLNAHRFLVYTAISVFAVSAVVANALRSYTNFYSVAISLSKSSRSVLALTNFGFLIALLCGNIFQRVFFGTLRATEVERLYDRLWFFITESLLAFTIFRDEFDIPFALMFGFLLFVKSFHWLAGDRIEWMDQRPYPGPSPLFHLRMSTLFVILWTTDLIMFLIALENTLTNGVGGMVLFASEYGILMASVLNTISKYLLSAHELRRAGRRGGENAPPWEHKSMWIFYIELATDFLKLTTYLIFFAIIITFYGLPLNIVRDVYITARSFVARLRAFHRYQTATKNMDQRYPNATAEELTSMSDRTCIICREEMTLQDGTQLQGPAPTIPDGPNITPKKLPCGHIFHFHCLRSWLERQQSCPTCRRTVLDPLPQGQNTAVPAPPGAADPQRPNPGAQNQNQNQNQRRVVNPLGNPLGLIGRLFGPPVQPPIVPPRFTQADLRRNQNNMAQNPRNLQEVFIQYHIQYQPPLQPQQHPHQPVQPPLPFPGFPGPGGVWQPWPIGPRDIAQDGMVPEGGLPGAVSPPNANPQGPSGPSVESSHMRHAPTLTGEAPVAPRDAAAGAALRRFNNSNTISSNSGISENNNPEDAGTTPAQSRSTLAGIPTLIPLYDYSTIDSGIRQTASSSPRTHLPPETHIAQSPHAMPPLDSHRQQGGPQVHLPPILTDEQLATMDRLTREAIDERLRVLEGVSGAIYRCIDDLMRMRSSLPSIPTINTEFVPSTNPEPSRSNGENDSRFEDLGTLDVPVPGPSGPRSEEQIPSRVANGKIPEPSQSLPRLPSDDNTLGGRSDDRL